MLSQRQLLLRKARSAILVGIGGTTAFGVIGMWTGNEKFFSQFVSPFLARMDPEVSHRAAVYAARHHLLRNRGQEDPPILNTKVGSLSLSNPVGIAAGFDKNGECISGLARMGFGWVEIGSVTPMPQEGNPKPRVFRLPEEGAVINRYGFNNEGHKRVRQHVLEFKNKNPDFIVGVNLGANKTSKDRIEDYCQGVKLFNDSADYFVINISSPNTPNLRELQNNENLPELLERVIHARNSQIRKVPLFLKVAPDLTDTDVKAICKLVLQKKTRVDGLIVANTTVSRESLSTNSVLKSETGGLSGRPLEKISTELVGKFYKELRGEIPIIGVGGVCNGEDAFRKIMAGASAVQLYTVLAYRGPGIVDRVKAELTDLLSSNGFASVNEAVGGSHRSR